MQLQEDKLRDVSEPVWVNRSCESCGGNEKSRHCWRMKSQTGECWYPPGSIKIVDEEPIENLVVSATKSFGIKAEWGRSLAYPGDIDYLHDIAKMLCPEGCILIENEHSWPKTP